MTDSPTIWIVDRDPRRRAALAQLAGSEHPSVLGAPEDSSFDSAALPRVVVLGLSSDFEVELDFVHRLRPRVGDCGWILIAQAGDSDEPARLFDTLEARILTWPPPPSEFRRAIRSLRRIRAVAPLSQRTGHGSLSARFARWFSGGELHWLLRTLDPSLASMPVLVRGEPGTGRRLLARYIHAFGSEPGAAFVPLFCEGVQTANQLLSQLNVTSLHVPGQSPPDAITIWLDDVDHLPPTIQQYVHSWIDFGLPGAVGLSHLRVRWTASAGEEFAERPDRQLEAGLEQALSGLVVPLAPLRNHPDTIARFVADTSAAWCEERGSRPREFDAEAQAALALYPWPGNLRELESVVIRTLASSASQIVTPAELRFDASGNSAASLPFGAESAGAAEIADAVIEPDPPPTPEGVRGTTGTGIAEQSADVSADVNPNEIAVEAELEPHEIDPLADTVTELGAEIGSSTPRDVENVRPAPPAVAAGGAPLPPQAPGPSDDSWARILRSVAHEVRNPLVSIRTFSELLPEHHDDSEFRARFSELVGADVRRIDEVVTRLQELSELSHAKRNPVDIASLIEELLEERRPLVEERGLLVLKELDHRHPTVLGDAQLLRSAFAGIFNRALEWVRERGDLYIASRYRSQRPGENPSVRILLRFQGVEGAAATRHPDAAGAAPTLEESTLEFVAARSVIVAQGGAFSFEANERETVVVVDLPAPPA